MATPESYRQRGQEELARKKQGAPQESPDAKTAAAYNKYRQMGRETLGVQGARQESAAEKRTKWTGKEIAKTGLGAVGGGAALGFLSVNYAMKFLLRKVKGASDFVNSWEWMEQTILGTRQRS